MFLKLIRLESAAYSSLYGWFTHSKVESILSAIWTGTLGRPRQRWSLHYLQDSVRSHFNQNSEVTCIFRFSVLKTMNHHCNCWYYFKEHSGQKKNGSNFRPVSIVCQHNKNATLCKLVWSIDINSTENFNTSFQLRFGIERLCEDNRGLLTSQDFNVPYMFNVGRQLPSLFTLTRQLTRVICIYTWTCSFFTKD